MRMTRRVIFAICVSGVSAICIPAISHAQTATSARPNTTAVKDTFPATTLARAAILKFFPKVLTDTTDPGTLFIILGADGKILAAAHGTLTDNDKLKAKFEDFDSRVESMEVEMVPAGALLPRALQVVITNFKP